MKRMLILLIVVVLLFAAGCGPAAEPIPAPKGEAFEPQKPAEETKAETPGQEEPIEQKEPEEQEEQKEPEEQEEPQALEMAGQEELPAEEAPEEAAPETPQEEAEPEAPAAEETDPSYLEKIAWADQSVFAEPSYDSVFVGTVELAGTYTIVEEAYDEEGNLWGKLKSGMGWVDLTDIRSEARKNVPVSANFAEERLLASGNYHSYVPAEAEYALQIAFRARETLRNVTLCTMVLNETMEPAEVIYLLDEWNADTPLVAELLFPGDMTCYGLRFTDAAGAERFFILSISGRNGMVCLTESEP